jgi:hypothetical protein
MRLHKLVHIFTISLRQMQFDKTQEEYYSDIVDLCIFMLHQINERPENIVDEEVQWPRVLADVHLMYDRPFNNDMLVDAIILIQEASNSQLTSQLEIPEGTTIH